MGWTSGIKDFGGGVVMGLSGDPSLAMGGAVMQAKGVQQSDYDPAKFDAEEWQAFTLGGGIQGVEQLRKARALRNPVALGVIDPRLMTDELNISPDNAMINQQAQRLEKQLISSGSTEAGAASAANRLKNRGFMAIADNAGSFYSQLLRLEEEAKRRKESMGPTRDPLTAQFQNFMGGF